jgi:prephenate dehydrogenase
MKPAEMSTGDLLPSARVAILGLGLMGGSLAMALRGRCAAVYGSDPDEKALELALRQGIVSLASADPAQVLPQADVVILAAPVQAILALLRSLPELHPGQAVVLDLGSTKAGIVAEMERLPPRFDPLGGHPMCGKETSTLLNADAGIFQGATFAFTPLARSSPEARALAEEIARGVGARPIFLDPDLHDRWVAFSSHLPYLVAAALAASTPVESSPLVGPGFRSTARLAASSPQVMLDVLATNRGNILTALQAFRQEFDMLEAALSGGEPGELSALLDGSARHLSELLALQARGEP